MSVRLDSLRKRRGRPLGLASLQLTAASSPGSCGLAFVFLHAALGDAGHTLGSTLMSTLSMSRTVVKSSLWQTREKTRGKSFRQTEMVGLDMSREQAPKPCKKPQTLDLRAQSVNTSTARVMLLGERASLRGESGERGGDALLDCMSTVHADDDLQEAQPLPWSAGCCAALCQPCPPPARATSSQSDGSGAEASL